MERGRCQPLQQRWKGLVRERAALPAVRLVAEGRVISFAELDAMAGAAPLSGPLVRAEGKGLAFLTDVLRAWRDDAVLLPVDGSPVAELDVSGLPPAICHVKTTSGSTGTPRQVWFTAEQLAADADQIVRTMGLRPDWPNFSVISMAHSYGFSNLVLPLLLHGIPLVIVESPLPQALRAALAAGGEFTVPAVPALWRAWHAAGVLGPQIRLAISAGAPLPLELEYAVFTASRIKIHNFYGSSECGGIAYDCTPVPRPVASWAGTAMEGVRLAVDETTGCLTVESPAVGFSYSNPDPALGGGRFLTADHVRLDECGVWLEGRAGETINVAGRKISPALIEEKLLTLPGVRHCVVFGIPSTDAARVDEIVACVNLAEGVSLREVRKASAGTLPASTQPRHWGICPDLEPDARGKISRAHWRDRWLEA